MRARYFVEENGTEGELRVSERRATEVAVGAASKRFTAPLRTSYVDAQAQKL